MADAGDDAEQKKPVFTFKKGKRRQAVRKQKCESDKGENMYAVNVSMFVQNCLL